MYRGVFAPFIWIGTSTEPPSAVLCTIFPLGVEPGGTRCAFVYSVLHLPQQAYFPQLQVVTHFAEVVSGGYCTYQIWP